MNSANFRLMLAAAFLLALGPAPLAQAQFHQGTGTTTPPRSLPPSGERTFTHSGTYTRTGPSGRAGGGTYSGQGSRQFLPGQGVEGDYSGQVTTQQGQTWNVNYPAPTAKRYGAGLSATRR